VTERAAPVTARVTGPAVPGLDQIETPAYVYDLDELRRAHSLLRAALPQPSVLFYSVKANPHPAIVAALARLGCRAEVSSPGELATALDAGLPPDHLLYTGPAKRAADVAAAVGSKVRWFSVDSLSGLRQVHAAAGAGPAACLLRINEQASLRGQGLAMTGLASQFGADAELVLNEPAAFRAGLAGLHLYMGSNLSDERALTEQFAAAILTASRLTTELSLQPELLNLGGGFAAPFARSGDLPRYRGLADALSNLLDGAFAGWRQERPAIAFESGRYLSGTCGHLLTRVLDVKRSHGRPVVILESGINHLGGMSGLRRLPPIVPELVGRGPRTTLHETIVAGPLCTPLDTWARSADVPAVRPGDVVQVPNVGAYGLSASLLAFLGHPAPREVVIDGGEITEVSQLTLVRRVLQTPTWPRARK
jgi:diaminopimelate decarboxylase